MKQNCWEFEKCGREPGGIKAKELGVCPAATLPVLNGIHGGKNAGRACWVVAGTMCGGQTQGTFAQKFQNCVNCAFYQKVFQDEGLSFVRVSKLLDMLDKHRTSSK